MDNIKNKIGTVTPLIATNNFIRFCDEVLLLGCANGDVNRIKFINDNISFDMMWINYYLCKYANHFPLHVFYGRHWSSVIDTSSYALALSKMTYEKVNDEIKINGYFSEDKACRQALSISNILKPPVKHDHTALNDAIYIVYEHAIHMKHNVD